jgi:putative hydrolase of the HAD superfamily
MQDLHDWDVALFDAGRTLIQQHPGLGETILAYSAHAGLGFSAETAERAADGCRSFADAHNLGSPPGERLDHVTFLLGFYRAGLRAALPALDEAEADRSARELFEFSEEVRHWIAIPGAREVLELFRHRRRRAGLVSNFSLALRAILESQGLLALLDPVVVSAEVGVEKPDPAILRIACSRAGIEPARAVYVGDHPLDVLCASRIGMRSIWVTDPDRAMPPSLGVEPDGRASSIALVPALLGLS